LCLSQVTAAGGVAHAICVADMAAPAPQRLSRLKTRDIEQAHEMFGCFPALENREAAIG